MGACSSRSLCLSQNKTGRRKPHKHRWRNTPKQILTVATINVNNIASPYLCCMSDPKISQQIGQINQKIAKMNQNQFKNMGELMYLSKKISHRYSPFYRKNAGIDIKTLKLLSQPEFEEMWQVEYRKNEGYANKIFDELNYFERMKKRILEELKAYDFGCYSVLVSHVYGKIHPEDKDNNLQSIIQKNRNIVFELTLFQQNLFQSVVISNEQRARKLLQFLEKQEINVVFLQEVDSQFLFFLEKFTQKYRFSYTQGQRQREFNKYEVICIWAGLQDIILPEKCRNIPLQLHNKARIYHNVPNRISIFEEVDISDISEDEYRDDEEKRKKMDPFCQKYEMALNQEQIEQLKIFEQIQFFGPLILISSRKKVEKAYIEKTLEAMRSGLQMLEEKDSNCLIMLGLSIELMATSDYVNPEYISSVFDNFYVYPSQPSLSKTQYIKKYTSIYDQQNTDHHTIANLSPQNHIFHATEDYLIISHPQTSQILSQSIQTLTKHRTKFNSQKFLPNQAHPFSHCILETALSVDFYDFSRQQN